MRFKEYLAESFDLNKHEGNITFGDFLNGAPYGNVAKEAIKKLALSAKWSPAIYKRLMSTVMNDAVSKYKKSGRTDFGKDQISRLFIETDPSVVMHFEDEPEAVVKTIDDIQWIEESYRNALMYLHVGDKYYDLSYEGENDAVIDEMKTYGEFTKNIRYENHNINAYLKTLAAHGKMSKATDQEFIEQHVIFK